MSLAGHADWRPFGQTCCVVACGWSGQAVTSNRRDEPGKLHDADDLTRASSLPKAGGKGQAAAPTTRQSGGSGIRRIGQSKSKPAESAGLNFLTPHAAPVR